MKILLVSSSYAPNLVSGAERVAEALAGALLERGHEVVVVTTQPAGDAAERVVGGVRVRYIPVVNVYRPCTGVDHGRARKALWHSLDIYNPFMGHVFDRILAEENPDVVHTHNFYGFSTSILQAVRRRGLPLVHTMHDQYLLCPTSRMSRGGRNCAGLCTTCLPVSVARRHLSQCVDVAVGVSRFILDRHVSFGYFPSSQKRVIYNAPRVLRPPDQRARTGRSAFRFGYLGAIHEEKGVGELIAAFAAECPQEAELWIGGRGSPSYEAELRRRSAGLAGVRWLGQVEPRELLDSIDVLVVPSLWHDTAPLVVLEAASQAKPVIGSNRGGIPEFITAETGWIYDADDPRGLSGALRRCLQAADRVGSMGAAAQEVSRRFTLSRFTEEYLDAYRSAARATQGTGGRARVGLNDSSRSH